MARPTAAAGRARGATSAMTSDWRSFQRTVRTALIFFLAVACVARLTGWRWRPWPPGPNGYGSILHEARDAAENCVATSFMA